MWRHSQSLPPCAAWPPGPARRQTVAHRARRGYKRRRAQRAHAFDLHQALRWLTGLHQLLDAPVMLGDSLIEAAQPLVELRKDFPRQCGQPVLAVLEDLQQPRAYLAPSLPHTH